MGAVAGAVRRTRRRSTDRTDPAGPDAPAGRRHGLVPRPPAIGADPGLVRLLRLRRLHQHQWLRRLHRPAGRRPDPGERHRPARPVGALAATGGPYDDPALAPPSAWPSIPARRRPRPPRPGWLALLGVAATRRSSPAWSVVAWVPTSPTPAGSASADRPIRPRPRPAVPSRVRPAASPASRPARCRAS